MKATKKKQPLPKLEPTYTETTHSKQGVRPYNVTEYPEVVESDNDTYSYLYLRHRFIIYEIYNAANLSVGFLCINSKAQFVIQGLPYQTMWWKMIAWADKCEEDESLKIICK